MQGWAIFWRGKGNENEALGEEGQRQKQAAVGGVTEEVTVPQRWYGVQAHWGLVFWTQEPASELLYSLPHREASPPRLPVGAGTPSGSGALLQLIIWPRDSAVSTLSLLLFWLVFAQVHILSGTISCPSDSLPAPWITQTVPPCFRKLHLRQVSGLEAAESGRWAVWPWQNKMLGMGFIFHLLCSFNSPWSLGGGQRC